MGNHLNVSVLAVVAALAFSSLILAQTPAGPGPAAGKAPAATHTPDLSGVWTLGRSPQDRGRARTFSETPPMTPEAAAKYKALLEAVKGRDENKDLVDPIVTSCAPPGPTRIMQQGRPFEMIQTPGRVIIIYEVDHWVRHVWTDG